MSKSKGNVVNPWDVFNTHGADATRWNMYTSGPPGNSRRFSVNLVGETVRKFLNTLWNTYSFFVTYANLSEWTPDLDFAARPAPGNMLDKWVLSELHKLVRETTEAMETYDVIGYTRPIGTFVENLSNWYVRLSRRRFWDSDPEALSTLHEVLVTLCQLLAPATPFVSEEIYQNLVARVNANAPDSVHLSRWPAVNATHINEQLSLDMEVVQRVTSLGHAARQSVNLKVRQPLAQVVVRTRTNEERAGLLRLQQFVLDELNVKTLAFTDAAGDLVDVSVFPYPKQLGQKYGKGYPKIRQAMNQMDQFALASRFQNGESVEIEAEGETYLVAPEDVEVRSAPRQGYSVAEAGGYLVAVTTEVDTALEQEGYARELVRRIQQLRKDAALAISDRIVTYVADQVTEGANRPPVNGDGLLHQVLAHFGDYVRDETLTVDLVQVHAGQGTEIPHHLPQASFELGDSQVTIAVAKK
jgi:isoleucyl-tRNA synthetase